MLANHEYRVYPGRSLVWVGKYRGLRNISHWHFDHEIACCESGNAVVSLDQTTYTLTKGQCIYLRGQSIHSILSDPETTLYVALFSNDLIRPVTDNYCPVQPVFADDSGIHEALEQIRTASFFIEQAGQTGRSASDPSLPKELPDFDTQTGRFLDERCNVRMQQLILDIFSGLALKKEPVVSSGIIEQYKHLLYDMDEHVEDYSFRRAVAFMHMSDAYFSRFFKQISGMTFSMYLNYIRVNRAIDLIRDGGLSMTEISASSGFETIRNFNRVFKQITGFAPRDLPGNYVLNLRSNSGNTGFDPTLSSSELMSGL